MLKEHFSVFNLSSSYNMCTSAKAKDWEDWRESFSFHAGGFVPQKTKLIYMGVSWAGCNALASVSHSCAVVLYADAGQGNWNGKPNEK